MVPVAVVHATLSGKWELTTCNAFQCYPVTHLLPPSLLLGPTQRGPQLPGTTYYVVIPGFLLPLEPQAPLPAGYAADYANCLAVHTVHIVL